MDPATFFWIALRASLLSSGGFGNLPLLHQDLVGRGWANDSQFATALAIGQLAPGPSGLWVVALGYLLGGVGPALLAALAVVFPPLLVVPVGRLQSRYAELPAVRGFVRGLVIGIAAIVPVIFLGVTRPGFNVLPLALITLSAVLIATRRVPLIVVLLLGAVAGAALLR
jgi:chromate transporter